MPQDIDILAINLKILSKFDEEINNLPTYKNRIKELKRALLFKKISLNSKVNLNKSIVKLQKKIDCVLNETNKNFYIIETASVIEKYKKILKTPMKLNFMGKKVCENKEKKEIIRQYLEIAKKYDNVHNIKEKPLKITCKNCENKKSFEIIDNNIYVCLECGTQEEVYIHTSSYKDIDRVNISVKYTYDRRVHFRDTINQYQGKQNCTIHQKVYDDLIEQFKNHHLLVGDEKTEKSVRFSKITKEHVKLFLTELDYTKHYENVNLIHFVITGIKPDDISHLEDKLLADFDDLIRVYDELYKNKTERKNFINTQHVLYQLLRKHKHPCKKEDFTILKTVDRKSFHDRVSSACFLKLGWCYNFFY